MSAAPHLPPEWAPHASCFTALPHRAEDWGPNLEPARQELAEMCRALADPDPASGLPRGEAIEMLVPDASHEELARERFGALAFRRIAYGDLWLRDTAPLFVRRGGREQAVVFSFNGWGGKYRMPGDEDLAERLADLLHVPVRRVDMVCEGGALEVDGEGTCLTTRDCVLNANRNPSLTEEDATACLRDALGVEQVLWLDGMLANDHTDGHIDTLVRFVAPAVAVCMEPVDDDPNAEVLRSVLEQLRGLRDARGRRFEAHTIPSPGRILDLEGQVLPASYCNFYVGNTTVVVPTYGGPHDDAAVEGIARLFPDRRTVGCSARAILTGGGAFHCVTQQRPAGTWEEEAP